MEELMEQTKTTIEEYKKSVAKLNLYSDRLFLEAEKGCVLSSQLRPLDERLVIQTSQSAIKFILQYSDLLDTIKEVDEKKKTVPHVDYPEYREKTVETMDNVKTDLLKLKLFREYSEKVIQSLIATEVENDSIESTSSCDNSYSFS